MHNVPEGICVAMPIYYATGSKWKVGACVAWLWLAGWMIMPVHYDTGSNWKMGCAG